MQSKSYKLFDFIVVGAGSGGLAAARRAAKFGKKVCIIQNKRLGGTCVNVGCVPKKIMFTAASFLQDSRAFQKGYGLYAPTSPPDFTTPLKIDWKTLKLNRDAHILKLNNIFSEHLSSSEICHINGTASFIEPDVVRCGEELLKSSNILIATGSKPVLPAGIEGIQNAITSDQFFELDQCPKSVLIIGNGYIGVEIGGIFNALGSKVTITGRGQRILTRFDSQIILHVQKIMESHGVEIKVKCMPTKILKMENGQFDVSFSNCDNQVFDLVLCATGRGANIDQLKLQIPKVKVEKSGFIIADKEHNTNIKGIFALGDVSGQMMLTPVAVKAGRLLAQRLFNPKYSNSNGEEQKNSYQVLDLDNVPTVIFSHPPLGIIGLSQEQAIEKYGKDNIKVYRSKFRNLFYAASSYKEETLMKLICQLPDQKVVGLYAAGKGVDEMIQGFGVAVKMGAKKSDFDACIAIHPTSSEEFVTMT